MQVCRIREGIFVSMIAGREEKKKIRKLPPVNVNLGSVEPGTTGG